MEFLPFSNLFETFFFIHRSPPYLFLTYFFSSSVLFLFDFFVFLSAKRYPYVSSEVFACEIFPLCDAVTSNVELLTNFWTFLDRPAPLNPLHASYFSKVNGVLLQKKPAEVKSYFFLFFFFVSLFVLFLFVFSPLLSI